jgi:lipooligosaccharide transport system permease protein
MPLFLFSGTFFPIEQLPDFLEPVAFLSPLFHGVELTRAAAGVAGSPHLPWWIHAGVLVALVVGGVVAAVRTLGGAMRK